MKILVCEDDEALASIIKFKLFREGYEGVVKVPDGREAKNMLKNEQFDMIITDIHMPYISGLELTEFVRNEQNKKTPIIILSAEGLESTVLEAFDLGVDDFITKPFSPSELAVRVKKLLRK